MSKNKTIYIKCYSEKEAKRLMSLFNDIILKKIRINFIRKKINRRQLEISLIKKDYVFNSK